MQRQKYINKKTYTGAPIAGAESAPTGTPTAADYKIKPSTKDLVTHDEFLFWASGWAGGTANAREFAFLVWLYFPDGGWQHTARLQIYSPEKTAANMSDEVGGIARCDGVGGATHLQLQRISVGGAPTDVEIHISCSDAVEKA